MVFLVAVAEVGIDAFDGTVPAGAFCVFAFSIDVPPGISEFTVRQYPTTDGVAVDSVEWSQIRALYR